MDFQLLSEKKMLMAPIRSIERETVFLYSTRHYDVTFLMKRRKLFM